MSYFIVKIPGVYIEVPKQKKGDDDINKLFSFSLMI